MFEVIAAHIVVDAMQAQFSDESTKTGKGRGQAAWRMDVVGRLRALVARYRQENRCSADPAHGAY